MKSGDIKTSLKNIYKASQCTDYNDCVIAIEQVNEIIKKAGIYNLPTKALYKRLLSLEKRKTLLDQKEYKEVLSIWDKYPVEKSKKYTKKQLLNKLVELGINNPELTYRKGEGWWLSCDGFDDWISMDSNGAMTFINKTFKSN